MRFFVVLPLLLPLVMGIAALVRIRTIRRVLVMAGAAANMLACVGALVWVNDGGIIVSQMGGHPAPYGISLVIDTLSAVMLSITGVITFTALVFSKAQIEANRHGFTYDRMMRTLI